MTLSLTKLLQSSFTIITFYIALANTSFCFAGVDNSQSILKIIQENLVTTTPTTLETAKHTVVSIRVKEQDQKTALRDAKTKKWGSGVLIAKNLVLTNHHVIGSTDELFSSIVVIDHIRVRANQPILLKELKIAREKNAIFFTNEAYDFTIFEIEPVPTMEDGSSRPIPHWHDALTKYDNSFVTISSPMGQSLWTSPACRTKISQELIEKHNRIATENTLFHLCDTFPGSSGAPIFDANGSLAGIHRMTYWSQDSSYIADFNEGVSFPFILKLLSSNKARANHKDDITLTKWLERNVEAANAEWGIESIIFGLPAGHEDITNEAATRLFHTNELLKNIFHSYSKFSDWKTWLVDGNVSVDYPTFWGIKNIPDLVNLYRSHYGKDAYLHAMLTDEEVGNFYLPKDRTQKLYIKLLAYIERQVNKILKMNAIDRQEGTRELGRLLHTLQDSFSPAHTYRDKNGIREFFYYEDSEHDKDRHKQLDLVRDPKTGRFKWEAEQAISATMKVLSAAYAGDGKEHENLIRILKDSIRLSDSSLADVSDQYLKSPSKAEDDIIKNYTYNRSSNPQLLTRPKQFNKLPKLDTSLISAFAMNNEDFNVTSTPIMQQKESYIILSDAKDSVNSGYLILQNNNYDILKQDYESSIMKNGNTFLPATWPPGGSPSVYPPEPISWPPNKESSFSPIRRPVGWPPGGGD